jgi:hypothetical protein
VVKSKVGFFLQTRIARTRYDSSDNAPHADHFLHGDMRLDDNAITADVAAIRNEGKPQLFEL